MRADRRTQVQVSVTLLVSLLLTGALALSPWHQVSCGRLVVASSNEKYAMLRGLAATYNGSGRTVNGACVTVAVEQVNSGDAELALERGWRGRDEERPDVWTPASRAWVVLLGARSPAGATLVPATYDSLFQSPTVIGMPQPMAAALGYPAKPIGWPDLATLISDPSGWATRGQAWGAFRLGKTNPNISTSGLHALIGTYSAADGLTADSVNSPPVREFAAGIESGVVHYGETASDFLLGLRDADEHSSATSYISAIAIEEKELLDYNAGVISGNHYGVPRTPLVPIYPKEGTPVADHPYVLLGSSRKGAEAAAFYAFLTEPAQQAVIDANNFRNRFGGAGRLLARRPLIQPGQPTRTVPAPAGPVLVAMLAAWQTLRKPARVLILVDAAARASALHDALSRLGDAVANFQPTDSAGIWTFPAPRGSGLPYVQQLAIAPASSRLRTALAQIQPAAGPADVDAALEAAVAALTSSFDSRRVDAVLLVEMSPDDANAVVDLQLAARLRAQNPASFVRVFTIGTAGSTRLRDLTLAGQGFSYQPGSASHFLNDVISNF